MNIREMAQAILTVTGYTVGASAKIFRQYNAVLNNSSMVWVSDEEPTRMLPLNVVWLDMNRDRETYMKFVRRVSKVPSNGLNNTWELVDRVESIWSAQYYDAQDGDPNLGNVDVATVDRIGIAKLNHPATQETAPSFVAISDPRLTDARVPLSHDELHPEKPLVDVIGVVNMDNGAAAQGATFVAASASSADQRKLTRAEITG